MSSFTTAPGNARQQSGNKKPSNKSDQQNNASQSKHTPPPKPAGLPLYLSNKIETDEALEREADQVAAQVLSAKEPPKPKRERKRESNTHNISQRHNSDTITSNGIPSDMGARFGTSFEDVKLHKGSDAAVAARRINAKAFTHGRDIVFGEGQYRPNSLEGRHLLAHELTHVLQQASSEGRVNTPVSLNSPPRLAATFESSNAPGLPFADPQTGPRSLNETLNVSALTETELRSEYRAIQRWLSDRPEQSSEDHERLRATRSQINTEASTRGIDLTQRQAPPAPESLMLDLNLAELSDSERETEVGRIRAWLAYSQESSPENQRLRQVLARLYEIERFQQSPPILWGLDTESRRIYASVAVPGYTLRQVATYMYGSESHASALLAANPSLTDGPLLPGTTVRLASGVNTTDMAHTAVNAALRNGGAMRTEGFPTSPDANAGQIQAYRVGGRMVTESQLPGVLEGSRVWVERKLNFIKSSLQAGLETRNDHESGTNTVVRNISDWLGDVDLPSPLIWMLPRVRCDVALALIRDTADLSNQEKANRISSAARILQQAGNSYNDARRAWRRYIQGTIEGAGAAVSTLEIVRDVSFGVAAGLAGAVAAPVVFAAAGGGLIGTGAALGAGTLAGAGTGAGLEFTSSVAGEAISNAVTPGDQNFDWGYVGHRTWEGTKSGAIQGGLGAAGALAAPGVSNVVANRMFGTNAMNLTSAGQRLAVNASTATIIGAPSGAAGASLENVDDLYRGDITGGEFASRVGWGTAMGGAMGAGTSWVPVGGLYRSGGGLFRGRTVTPRWMMEGVGFNPHQVSPDFTPTLNPFAMRQAVAGRYSWNPQGNQFAAFNALSLDQLPALGSGRRWVRINGEWHPLSTSGRATGDPYSLQVQGDVFNMNVGQRGGPQRTLMSRAMTRNPTFSGSRSDQGVLQFQETMPDGSTTPHTPGHNIDMADTPNATFAQTGDELVGPQVSNMHENPLQFTPEPRSSMAGNRSVSDWGQWLRNNMVNNVIRPAGGGYRQYNSPSATGRVATGTRPGQSVQTVVPDNVVFVQTDMDGVPVDAWSIPFTNNPPTARTLVTMTGPNSPYRISLNQLPIALQGNVMPVALPIGGPVGAAQSDE